jgi:flagellar hook-associated protein 1 FlgK
MGAGVEVAKISRATDRLGDLRVRGTTANASFYGERAELMQQVEDVFGEPDHGVSTALTQMWTTLSTWAVNPSDDASRNQVLSRLQGTADRINQVRGGLEQLATDAGQRLSGDVADANAMLTKLVEINRFSRDRDGLPADIADQRDIMLDTLAATIGAVASVDDDGQVRVTLNGLALVDGDRATPLQYSAGPPPTITHPSGPVTLGGTAGGLQVGITSDLADTRAQLDSFVAGLISALNTVHAGGFTPSGSAGGPLLAESAGRVSVAVSAPGDLAAADVAGQPLNGRTADALSQLRGSQGDALRSLVSAMSGKVAGVKSSADTAHALADNASQQRDASVGVNVDEEMTELMSQQRAYQAAARLVSVVDEMLQSLIGM